MSDRHLKLPYAIVRGCLVHNSRKLCCHQTFGCPCLIRQLPGGDDACHVDDLRVHLDVACDVEDGDGDLHRTRDDGLRVYGLHYRLILSKA